MCKAIIISKAFPIELFPITLNEMSGKDFPGTVYASLRELFFVCKSTQIILKTDQLFRELEKGFSYDHY